MMCLLFMWLWMCGFSNVLLIVFSLQYFSSRLNSSELFLGWDFVIKGSSVRIVMVEKLNSVLCVSICIRFGDRVIQCRFVLMVDRNGLCEVSCVGVCGCQCSSDVSSGMQFIVLMVKVVVVLKVVVMILFVVGFMLCIRLKLIEFSDIVVVRFLCGIRLFMLVCYGGL